MKLLFILMMLAASAFGRTNYNVYRMPSSGNFPGWGPIDLSQAGAVTGFLGSANLNHPTVRILSAGSTAGYAFYTTVSITCAAGDTYTNNAQTFTALYAVTAQTGTVFIATGTGAPTSSGTLTRATGSGTASFGFNSEAAYSTYTTPTNPAPIYIRVRLVGAGGGGGGGDGASGNGTQAVPQGTASLFGQIIGEGGLGGGASCGTGVGLGGPVHLGDGAFTLGSGNGVAVVGGTSTEMEFNPAGTSLAAGIGAASAWAAGGAGASSAAAATAGTYGAGGGGGMGVVAKCNGQGGGGGGAVDTLIYSPAATYPFAIGVGGSAGSAGSGGGTHAAAAGGNGAIIVTEYYQ